MDKKIKNNAKITLLVGILIVMVIITTTTYAYFKTRIKSPGSKISITGSNFSLNITDNALTASGLKPIYDTNKTTQGIKKEFTISIGSEGVTSACYDMYIDVTKIGENLRNKHFKYELTNGTISYTGNFYGKQDGSQILIMRNQNINSTNTSNTYTLYLWLSYSETEEQGDILTGDAEARTFKGKILAKAVTGTCKETDTDPTIYMASVVVRNGTSDETTQNVIKGKDAVFNLEAKDGYDISTAEVTLMTNSNVSTQAITNEMMTATLNGSKLTIANVDEDVTALVTIGGDELYPSGSLANKILEDNPTVLTRTDFSVANTDDTTGTIYVQSSTSTSQMTEDTDGDGIGEDTYYYSGNTTNNWVKFAGYYVYRGTNSAGTKTRDFKTMEKCTSNSTYGNNCTAVLINYYWRIVRINEDGSVRLAYQGESTNQLVPIVDSVANHWWNNEGYDDSSYLDTKYASRAKTEVDYWYMDNLVDKSDNSTYNFDDYISLTAIYCSDDTFYKRVETKTGYYLKANGQLRMTNKTPTFLCGGDGKGNIAEKISGNAIKLSASTTGGGNTINYCASTENYEPSKSWYGYRKLDTTMKCPIAMLTVDEIMYAGYLPGTYYSKNTFHLFVNSENKVIKDIEYMYFLTPNTDEHITSISFFGYADQDPSGGIRPVLSLKSCVKYSGGDGTSTNPYTVTIDGTCASAEN